jgi:hypothetical protein
MLDQEITRSGIRLKGLKNKKITISYRQKDPIFRKIGSFLIIQFSTKISANANIQSDVFQLNIE